MERNTAQKLDKLIEMAKQKDWDIEGHDGKNPIVKKGAPPIPGFLKYTSEHLIEEQMALAVLMNTGFLDALFGDEAKDIAAKMYGHGDPKNQIDYVYYQALRRHPDLQ